MSRSLAADHAANRNLPSTATRWKPAGDPFGRSYSPIPTGITMGLPLRDSS
jgi:hypothetical protein